MKLWAWHPVYTEKHKQKGCGPGQLGNKARPYLRNNLTNAKREGGMAQVVVCLLSKDLRQGLSTWHCVPKYVGDNWKLASGTGSRDRGQLCTWLHFPHRIPPGLLWQPINKVVGESQPHALGQWQGTLCCATFHRCRQRSHRWRSRRVTHESTQ
jgi:hypothetical protein